MALVEIGMMQSKPVLDRNRFLNPDIPMPAEESEAETGSQVVLPAAVGARRPSRPWHALRHDSLVELVAGEQP
jgi:hypothetical protein